MRFASSLAMTLVAGCALALGCTGLNAASQLDEPGAGGGANGFLPGTVGSQCTPSADGCQWTANECEADPACAKWYACVLTKPADENLKGAIQSCQSTPLSQTQKKLLTCLVSSGSCEGLVGPSYGASGAGGTKTETPNAEAGAGAYDGQGGTNGGAGSSGYDPECPNQPLGDPANTACYDCILGTCCAPFDGTENMAKCYAIKHTTACWQGLAHEWQMENCLYNAQQPDGQWEFTAAAHDTLVNLGVMSCFLSTCAQVCAPPDARCCMKCTQANCPDLLATYVDSAQAQDYQWCRTHCDYGMEGQPLENQADCRELCQAQYPDGFAIVSALVGCKYDQCPVCNSLP